MIGLNVTTVLLALIIVGSITAWGKTERFDRFKFNPYMVVHRKEWYRLFTHGFLHGDPVHLVFNVVVLESFGGVMENHLVMEHGLVKGTIYFAVLYLGGLVAATLPALTKHSENHSYNSVGASGAVYAVMIAYILKFPLAELGLLLIPIGIKAFILGFIILAIDMAMNKRGGSRIAHDAHLGGAAFGAIAMLAFDWHVLPEFLKQISAWFNGFFA